MGTLNLELSLSTSWNGSRHQRVAGIVEEHRGLGFRQLEAYCHFTPDQLEELRREAGDREVVISSLHSPCPVAVDDSGARARWGDWLASTVESERVYGVDAIKRTIDFASEVGARGVVIHLGNVGIFPRQRTIVDAIAQHGRSSEEHRRLVDEAWRERESRKGPHLDAALRSIRALGEHAAGTPVRLGVEARDGYHEIPSLDEVADVLSACDGLPVYYWHDAGHGAKLEYAGFVEHEDYLRRYGDRMLGMHIHDTLAGRDHLAPGQGETDFAMLARYLRPETIRTVELHSHVTPEQISHAVQLLSQLGIGSTGASPEALQIGLWDSPPADAPTPTPPPSLGEGLGWGP